MPNGFMFPGGGSAPDIILRAKGTEGVAVEAALNSKTYKGTVGPLGFVDIKLKELGEYAVTVNMNGSIYTQTVNVYQYGITEFFALSEKPFADCTPEEIQAIARAGFAQKFWEIGDKHKVMLKDGEEIYLQIYGFDHDLDSDGENTLPLTLGMENCFKTTRSMNGSNTNAGGWSECNFRKNILPSLKENFPDEWQNIMTKCQKKTSSGSNNSSIQTTGDDLFMFSEVELFGSTTYSFAGEGEVYKIFTDSGSRVKKVNDVASWFWTRSPAKGTSTNFCNISAGGGCNYSNNGMAGIAASTLSGVALGFCVG